MRLRRRTRRGGMYLPSETESEAPELAHKKTLVKNVRHFLNRTWKTKVTSARQLKALMKYEVEKLQEELETNGEPKYFYHKQPTEDAYMIYRGLSSEMPPDIPKQVPLPPNVSLDPEKKGLKLDDVAIQYFRGDYPLFIPFYGDEVSGISRNNFIDPITQAQFPIGSYIVQFTHGAYETFMSRTSLIQYWNRPYPMDTPEERTRLFAEKLKNPTTKTPFHDFYAKFVKVVEITAAERDEFQQRKHEERAQLVSQAGKTIGNAALATRQTIGNVANATGQTVSNAALATGQKVKDVALKATGAVARTALGATGIAAQAVGKTTHAVGYAADLTKVAAQKTGLTNVAAAADYASLAAHGIGKGVDNVGKTAVTTAWGRDEPEKEKSKSWFETLFY